MTEWNEQRLKGLVRKMGLRRTSGQGKTPIHLSLYGPGSEPLLTKIMRFDATAWAALGYVETDRVSAMKALGRLGCRVSDEHGVSSLEATVGDSIPLTPELARILVDAGCVPSVRILHYAAEIPGMTPELFQVLRPEEFTAEDAHGVMVTATYHQRPLPAELAKLLMDAGADPARNPVNLKSIDMLQRLANSELQVDPETADLFIRAGCNTDLSPARFIDTRSLERLRDVLQLHAAWKEEREHAAPSGDAVSINWGR